MKKTVIISLLFAVSASVRAAQISDDFSREDTTFNVGGSKVGERWVNSGEDLWRISDGILETDLKSSPSILYNTGLQLDGAFTARIDAAAVVYGGLVFNYQNSSNYYELRFKAGTKAVHLQCLVDGVAENLLIDKASATFVPETMYTLMVTSGSPYHFDVSIAEAGGGAVLYSATDAVDTGSRHTQGYAGAYATSGDARFDNFNAALVTSSSLCFMTNGVPSEIPAVSGLSAEVRSGQVFLTWNEDPAVDGVTFNAFMYSAPITAETVSNARKIGHHIEPGSACDWWRDPASFKADAVPDRSHGFVLDGKELDPRGGLFVHTVTKNDPAEMYFAVIPSTAAASDLVLGGNSLETAVVAKPALIEPIQLQAAPKFGSAAGKSLTLVLHGRGGGSNADGKANFLVFGDSLQGWREGLARKFVVESNEDGIIIYPLDRTWVNRPLLFSWDARDHVPAVNTWWYGCNDHIYDAAAVPNGVVVNYTEEHLLYLVRWAQKVYGTDPNRTYLRGISMGGSGAISVGFHHPDVFSSIFSDVPIPVYTHRAGSDGRYNLMRLDGLCGRVCDKTVMSSDGIPVMERMDGERIALEYPGELPFLVLCNGRNDRSMPWVNNPFFYRALNQGHRGFACYWNDGAHDMGSSVPQDIREFYSMHPGMGLNVSYPAFSNCSANRDPGNGEKTDGDITGWMNRGIYWADLAETKHAWSVNLSIAGDFLPESITVDVTPRNLTVFNIAPDETLLVNGSELKADEKGLLTVPSVQINKGKSLLLQVRHR